MSFENKNWVQSSVHNMVASFLRAERHHYECLDDFDRFSSWIDRPDISCPDQNHARLRMLYYKRKRLVGEIPPDTVWYEVSYLTEQDLDWLLVIARCGWDDPGHMNELRKVAVIKMLSLTIPPSEWQPIILWGHTEQGPFTILEGNHRLAAYCWSQTDEPLKVPVIVGLSPTPCLWHKPDPELVLLNDMWK